MTIYGLTGQTGAGKSTVSQRLREKGFYILDGDFAARQVVKSGSDVLRELSEAFGHDIIAKDGTLDRALLAQRAFISKDKTRLLNEITHRAIDEYFKSEIRSQAYAGSSKFIIDAAALLESPSKKLCEKIIVVTAPRDIRLERIMKRDALSLEAALLRINAQPDEEYFTRQADVIIRNFPPYNIDEEIERIAW